MNKFLLDKINKETKFVIHFNLNFTIMRTTVLIFIIILSMNCTTRSQPIENEDKLVGISTEILENLVNGHYSKTTKDFNDKVIQALSPEKLAEVYEGLTSQIGNYKEKGETITDVIDGYRIVYIIMKFEKSPFKLKVAFDNDDKVAGLFLIPVNVK